MWTSVWMQGEHNKRIRPNHADRFILLTAIFIEILFISRPVPARYQSINLPRDGIETATDVIARSHNFQSELICLHMMFFALLLIFVHGGIVCKCTCAGRKRSSARKGSGPSRRSPAKETSTMSSQQERRGKDQGEEDSLVLHGTAQPASPAVSLQRPASRTRFAHRAPLLEIAPFWSSSPESPQSGGLLNLHNVPLSLALIVLFLAPLFVFIAPLLFGVGNSGVNAVLCAVTVNCQSDSFNGDDGARYFHGPSMIMMRSEIVGENGENDLSLRGFVGDRSQSKKLVLPGSANDFDNIARKMVQDALYSVAGVTSDNGVTSSAAPIVVGSLSDKIFDRDSVGLLIRMVRPRQKDSLRPPAHRAQEGGANLSVEQESSICPELCRAAWFERKGTKTGQKPGTDQLLLECEQAFDLTPITDTTTTRPTRENDASSSTSLCLLMPRRKARQSIRQQLSGREDEVNTRQESTPDTSPRIGGFGAAHADVGFRIIARHRLLRHNVFGLQADHNKQTVPGEHNYAPTSLFVAPGFYLFAFAIYAFLTVALSLVL